MFAEWGVGVLVGKRVVAMRNPSLKRYCMVFVCSNIASLVLILSERVYDKLVGGVIYMEEKSLLMSRWS